MTKGTGIPKGYKQTKVGLIPEDWEDTKLSEVIFLESGQHLNPEEYTLTNGLNSTPYFTGPTDFNNNNFSKWTTKGRKFAKHDSVLITVKGSGVGSLFFLNVEKVAIGRQLMAIQSKNSDITFLHQLLKTKEHRFKQLAAGNMIPGLSRSDILSIRIGMPSFPEQQKIATILTTWDNSISTTQSIIEKLKLRNKGLSQQLLTGKKRLKGFSGEWRSIKIEKILRESREPSKNSNPSRRISVKLNLKGIEKREERGTESKDSTAYFIRKAGQFIYGRQNLHKGALGIIPDQLDGFESTQDIPAFDFTDKVDSRWFLFFISRENFYTQLENIATGTGSKRIHPKNLFKISIPVPSLIEQSEIASFLEITDQELKLFEKKLNTLREQKKGLMQKLLTGQIRVGNE